MREAGALSSIAPSVDPRGAAEVNKGAQFCDNAVTWCAVYDRAGRRRATGPWCAQGVWGHASDERCARLIPKYLTASCRAWHDRDSPQMGPCGGKRQRCPEGRRCLRLDLLPREALCFAYLLPLLRHHAPGAREHDAALCNGAETGTFLCSGVWWGCGARRAWRERGGGAARRGMARGSVAGRWASLRLAASSSLPLFWSIRRLLFGLPAFEHLGDSGPPRPHRTEVRLHVP